MRAVDADKLLEEWDERTDDHRITDSEFHRMINEDLPLIELGWHYPSKGEYPDKDWSKHPLNVSKECFIVTKRGIGTIARWDNDYKMWFENQPNAPITEVIAWQYFVQPQEES